MSTINQLERDQVCLCPKREVPVRNEYGFRVGWKTAAPSFHTGDCQFYQDNSHAEGEDSFGNIPW